MKQQNMYEVDTDEDAGSDLSEVNMRTWICYLWIVKILVLFFNW